jgi:PAS domain S-box-containing protein
VHLSYGLAILASALAAYAMHATGDLFERSMFLPFLLCTTLVALGAGPGPALLSTALNAAFIVWVMIEPSGTFAIARTLDRLLVAGYLFAGAGVAVVSDLLRRSRREAVLREDALRERIKEQHCLYDVSTILNRSTEEEPVTLRRVLALLPAGWQRPHTIAARLVLHDDVEEGPAFRETSWRQSAVIVLDGRPAGTLEVFSVQAGPQGSDPFLPEEQLLLDAIAARVAEYLMRRRAEHALRKSEAFHRSLIDNATELVSIVGEDGIIRFASRATRQLGYSPAERQGRDAFELIHPDDVALARAVFAEVLAGRREGLPVEYRAQGRDGDWRWFESTARDLRHDPHVNGIVIHSRDVTERKRAEARLRDHEERLHQGRKLEAIGRLAGGVAHDFNNLLTGIHGFAQLALDRLPADPVRADLEQIQRSADRAAGLTRQLLAFGRKQVLQSRILDLNTVVRDTDRLLRRLLREDIRFTTALADDLGAVNADPGQVEQIILNLALNARDAMASGGNLIIETANATLTEEEAARHRFEVRTGPYVLLSVCDTGPGMDDHVLEHVFEPFFTTKELGRGTGLGLSTVYGIVKQSGGYIWFETKKGKGTTVRVYLPRVSGRPVPITAAPPVPAETGHGIVLLVEDDDTVRALARRVLRRQGYDVLEACNGVEAMRIAEGRDRRIDLVLTDVVMPEMGGRQLIERLRRIRPELPFLLMSGYTDDAIVRDGLIGAGDRFIEKPFTTTVLAQRVRLALDHARSS